MTPEINAADTVWQRFEAGFNSFDQTRLFYRVWQPTSKRSQTHKQALIFLHRGHEHSGRIQPLVEAFGFEHHWAFAWDARGHGYSPGERGCAPDFQTLVRDFDCFMQHISREYGIALSDMLIVANSVGAVLAATWLHDYAPTVRGLVMAATAFSIKLYVPLAKPLLRLALCFNPDLKVSSYIKASMLTHDPQQIHAYSQDPLITQDISARVLLDLAKTAERIVADAGAIHTPIFMLVAEKDYVVHNAPQQVFFQRISSDLKQFHRLDNAYHAVLYEQNAHEAITLAKRFIEKCFDRPAQTPKHLLHADLQGYSALQYQALLHDYQSHPLEEAAFALQRFLLKQMGSWSEGMRIGLQHGFDSGASLDYVYRNRAQGRFVLGKWIDQGYLNAIGWRGIRRRREQLQSALQQAIEQHQGDEPLKILDIAAGSGRYILETIKRYPKSAIQVTLRDYQAHNLQQAQLLATELGLNNVTFEQADAFDLASYPDEALYDVVMVSGLYELFAENAPVMQSLQGICRVLKANGLLIYTAQPWHPQLKMIAKTLTDHQGKFWVMRPRSQAEMDALVRHAGCEKIATSIGLEGIFSVSIARKL